MSSPDENPSDSNATPSATLNHKAPDSDLVGSQKLFRDTAKRAYQKFEARGSKHGSDVDDWLMSEREMLAEQRIRREAE